MIFASWEDSIETGGCQCSTGKMPVVMSLIHSVVQTILLGCLQNCLGSPPTWWLSRPASCRRSYSNDPDLPAVTPQPGYGGPGDATGSEEDVKTDYKNPQKK